MLTGGKRYSQMSEDALISVTVFVFREGAKETLAKVKVSYTAAAKQAKWECFMNSVARVLKLQGIDGVYTEHEGYIVARIASLREGGRYSVRPTEASALTRSLTIDKRGHYPSWDIVDRGRQARTDLDGIIATFVEENGPLPPLAECGSSSSSNDGGGNGGVNVVVSLPWIVKPEEILTTAAAVRAKA